MLRNHIGRAKLSALAGAISILLIGAGCLPWQREAPPEDPGLAEAVFFLVASSESEAYERASSSTAHGCDDRLMMQKKVVDRQDVSPLQFNMSVLLDVTSEEAHELGLYTPFGPYDVRAEVFEEEGKQVINIVGDVISAGHCDDPRVHKMIQETARLGLGYIPEIRWNGSERDWRCLGDESGMCE